METVNNGGETAAVLAAKANQPLSELFCFWRPNPSAFMSKQLKNGKGFCIKMEVKAYAEVRLIKASKRAANASKKKKKNLPRVGKKLLISGEE